ncbi:MAG: hypothetical protein ACYCZK_05305 [Microbacteriaceae bacterium]
MSEGSTEDQWREKIRALKEAHPEAKAAVDGLAAGILAGPVSADRPPVPVWEYLDYLTAHPRLSQEDLSQIRFPIMSYGGVLTITSIAELTATPGLVSPTFKVTPEDVVRLYGLMYALGVMRWNPDSKVHEEVVSPTVYAKGLYEKWASGLQFKSR